MTKNASTRKCFIAIAAQGIKLTILVLGIAHPLACECAEEMLMMIVTIAHETRMAERDEAGAILCCRPVPLLNIRLDTYSCKKCKSACTSREGTRAIKGVIDKPRMCTSHLESRHLP